MKIPVSKAKFLRESLDLTHIVIFGLDRDGVQHVATHGESVEQAEEAAAMGNNLKQSLGWPKDLCNSVPVERICKNCIYYKADYGSWCFNGWSKDGKDGFCSVYPDFTYKRQEKETCLHFTPH